MFLHKNYLNKKSTTYILFFTIIRLVDLTMDNNVKFWNKMDSVIITQKFSCSVMSDSLQPHELQHARPPCRSPTPGVHPNLYPLSQ